MYRFEPMGKLLLAGFVGAVAFDGACAPVESPSHLDGEQSIEVGLALRSDDYVEVGDLQQLRERGKLRVLVYRAATPEHHGAPATDPAKLRYLQDFATELGMEVSWIPIEDWDDLMPALQEGRGDVVAVDITETPALRDEVAFTIPLETVREQVILRSASDEISLPSHLEGQRISLRQSSPAWDALLWLQERYPNIELEALTESLSQKEIFDGLKDGTYDITVAPSSAVGALMDEDVLQVAFNLTTERKVSWALRRDNRDLKAALDRYFLSKEMAGGESLRRRQDLAQIEDRGVLRVLTQPDAGSCYLKRGEIAGFECELIQRFADQRDLRVEWVVPPSRADLLHWLRDGRGDMVAAGMVIPEGRAAFGLAYSQPFQFSDQVFVGRDNETPLDSLDELQGRQVVVQADSAQWETLSRLRAMGGLEFQLITAPDGLTSDELIVKVADGDYDLALVDSHIADIVQHFRPDIEIGLPVAESSHGWVVRDDAPELLEAIDDYVDRTYRGVFYNLVYRRYFKGVRSAPDWLFDANKKGRISPYDPLLERYADQYGFDWRLIAAQMYQESRFNPRVRSHRGAMGLMQVLPQTGLELGVKRLHDPAASIHAGVKYLAQMRQWLPLDMPSRSRIWFALASYNVGWGHVLDARRVARLTDRDPDRWFDNTEQAMLEVSGRRFTDAVKHGYCDGEQPVDYVQEIHARYNTYVQLSRPSQP